MNNQKNGLKAMVLAGFALCLFIGSALTPTQTSVPTQVPSMAPLAVTATYPTATAFPMASRVAPK